MVEVINYELQAKDRIQICDAGLKELRSAGMETSDIENLLKVAHSFFILGQFDRSCQFADRAHRLILEMMEIKDLPRVDGGPEA